MKFKIFIAIFVILAIMFAKPTLNAMVKARVDAIKTGTLHLTDLLCQ